MEQVIQDPNRSDRWSYIGVGVFLCGLSLILSFTNPGFPTVSIVAVPGGLLTICLGLLSRPYVVMDGRGVTHRFLFRKAFHSWDEILQVGIRNTKATKVPFEYLFPVVIVFPVKQKWQNCRLIQDIFYSVLMPNRPEIRKFIAAYYGALDFDDTDSLNDWQKRVYGFRKQK